MKGFLFLSLLLVAPVMAAVGPNEFMMVMNNAAVTTSSFTYYSAVFDGSTTWLNKGSALTGATDGKQGTFSFWIKMDSGSSDTTEYYIILGRGSASRFLITRTTAGQINFRVRDTSATQVAQCTSTNNSVVKASGWRHVLFAFNTATPVYQLYIQDVDNSPTEAGTTDGLANWEVSGWYIGENNDTTGRLPGLLCEMWFDDSYIDISNTTNRRKFITAGLKPENLGSDGSTPTGSQPLVYFHNQVPNWENNLGGGGTFTENGTLVDGGSDKP